MFTISSLPLGESSICAEHNLGIDYRVHTENEIKGRLSLITKLVLLGLVESVDLALMIYIHNCTCVYTLITATIHWCLHIARKSHANR